MSSKSGMGAKQCQLTDDDEQSGLSFEIQKGRLFFRLTASYSDERRRWASKAAEEEQCKQGITFSILLRNLLTISIFENIIKEEILDIRE